jgi:hypothetical protein
VNKNPSPATRFRPGQTGNPRGSSRKAQDRAKFTAALTKLLAEKGAAGKFLQAGWDAAIAGDFQFWRYLWERLEGKVPAPEPLEQLDLEMIARRMQARYKEIRSEGPTSPPDEPPAPPAVSVDAVVNRPVAQEPGPLPCGLKELSPAEPEPRPPVEPMIQTRWDRAPEPRSELTLREIIASFGGF